jgi:hypothetical protein
MRDTGVGDVLVYCRDHRSSHHIEISGYRWPDHVRLSDVEPDFVNTLRQARRGSAASLRKPEWGRLSQDRPNTLTGRPPMDYAYARTHNL